MNPALKIGFTAALLVVATTVASSAERERRRSSDPAPKIAAPAAAANAAPANSFEAFQLITERNIFNPNRVGRVRAIPEEKPPRVDELSLVGTMQYEKGLLAFFESPDAALRKAAREGDTVGEFTVRKIAADTVELTRGEQAIPLKVAQQLRRPEGGEWKVSAVIVDTSAPGTLRSARPGDAPLTVEIPADASDVLKRLMKQREKQLK